MENIKKLQLKKILNYCIDNNLFFNFSPHVESVHVYSEGMKINLMAYYDGELYGYEDNHFVHIEKAIDLIKEFKQSNK